MVGADLNVIRFGIQIELVVVFDEKNESCELITQKECRHNHSNRIDLPV
jgi:hypothetical protein